MKKINFEKWFETYKPIPNHIDKIQSIYSNIYLTKDGNLIIKDNQVKESIFIYDKDTYINNFTDSSNGYYIYCNR